MDEKLPDDFDVIVVGTGLTESIVSGALSRIGKKILHLDHFKNYGSDWSSFNLKGFEARIKNTAALDISLDEDMMAKVDSETEVLLPIKSVRSTIHGGEVECYLTNPKTDFSEKNVIPSSTKESLMQYPPRIIPPCTDAAQEVSSSNIQDGHHGENRFEKIEEDLEKKPSNNIIAKVLEVDHKKVNEDVIDKTTRDCFYSKYRHYNLDLTPKLMFSRESLVELLIASNVCRYLEFCNVTGNLTLMGKSQEKLVLVPCSRTDIFNSQLITMMEKRLLMRVLTSCANFDSDPKDYEDFADKPFMEYLSFKRLSKKLQHFVIHSIAMVPEDISTMDGLEATQRFLKSLGRFGNTAFLWTMYGTGELPQAFCRLSAVFGGTFCLNRFPKAMIVSKESGQCIGILDSTGQRLKCKYLIINECYTPESSRIHFKERVARAVYVTDSALHHVSNGTVSLLSIPPRSGMNPACVIEVTSKCHACPSEVYVTYAMMINQKVDDEPASSKFSKLEELLFSGKGYTNKKKTFKTVDAPDDRNTDQTYSKKPNVLWAAYFFMESDGFDSSSLPINVSVTCGPHYELGFDKTISEARSLFQTVCPGELFLPRAPDPEEIIFFDQIDKGYNTETNRTGDHNTESPEEYQEE